VGAMDLTLRKRKGEKEYKEGEGRAGIYHATLRAKDLTLSAKIEGRE